MLHCVSDKHLERLKVKITNYQIGGVSLQTETLNIEKKNVHRTQECEMNWLNINAFMEMKCQVMKINNA